MNFPEYSPELLNVIFAVASGISALFFGKLGDICVRRLKNNLNFDFHH